jgi:hypothetical protein
VIGGSAAVLAGDRERIGQRIPIQSGEGAVLLTEDACPLLSRFEIELEKGIVYRLLKHAHTTVGLYTVVSFCFRDP